MTSPVPYLLFGLLFSGTALAQTFELIAPADLVPGSTYPMALEVVSAEGLDLFHTEEISVNTEGGQIPDNLIKIKKGRGMVSVQTSGADTVALSGTGLNLHVTANPHTAEIEGGIIQIATTWSAGTVHHLTSDLHVSQSGSLTIQEGCWILLDPAVNIFVDGQLGVIGTRQAPVTFCSFMGGPGWGGVLLDQGSAELDYCLFTGGGADSSLAFGHSNSQPIIKTNGPPLTMNHCYIFDGHGKALGAEGATLSFRNGGISRCDTGGEFWGSQVEVSGSHVLDIPNDDGIFQDDDNDGFYFSGTHPSGTSTVDSCVFMIGKDDGIDHNGAILEIRHCWIEGFENEGIAASNENSVYVYNSLFKDCEQGIEAGYGSPQITVDHCVMVDNDYGLRFGDWYDWGCSGSITCTNSIMANNDDNIHNYDVLSGGAIPAAINVSYSLTNDGEYDSSPGCLAAQPNFSPVYLLEPGSPGVGAAADGSDMGLVSGPLTGVTDEGTREYGDRSTHTYDLFDLSGRFLFSTIGFESLNNKKLQLQTGIYVVKEQYAGVVKNHRIGIVR